MSRDDDSDIHHKETGRNIKLHKKGSVLVTRMNVMTPEEGARSLGERNENARALVAPGRRKTEDISMRLRKTDRQVH